MSASSTERISEIKVLPNKPNCEEAKRIMEMVAKAGMLHIWYYSE